MTDELTYVNLTPDLFDALNDPSVKLRAWFVVAAELERVKALETHMRKASFANYFGESAGEGTKNYDLGNGYTLKAIGKMNYKFATNDKVDEALEKIEELGEKGKFVAERLVKWDPRLSLTEYKALSASDPIDAAIKANVDSVLTATPGMPSLEIVPPKAK